MKFDGISFFSFSLIASTYFDMYPFNCGIDPGLGNFNTEKFASVVDKLQMRKTLIQDLTSDPITSLFLTVVAET